MRDLLRHNYMLCTPLNISMFGVLALAGGMMAFAVYLAVFQYNPPITFFDDPGATDKAVYHVGDVVRVHRSVCQFNKLDGVLHLILVGRHDIYPLPDVNRPYREGCVQVDFPALTIPPTLKPDTYYIDARIDIVVNRLATRSVPWRSQLFVVE